MLQDCKSVSDHFTTLRSKGLIEMCFNRRCKSVMINFAKRWLEFIKIGVLTSKRSRDSLSLPSQR